MRIVRSITIKEPLRADPWCRYVKKEFAYAFSCAYTELWMHLEVWRALKKLALQSAIASSNSYASFVLSKLPACIRTLSMNKFLICPHSRSVGYKTEFAFDHLPDVDNSDGRAVYRTISKVMGCLACHYFSAGLLCIPAKVTHSHAVLSLISYK